MAWSLPKLSKHQILSQASNVAFLDHSFRSLCMERLGPWPPFCNKTVAFSDLGFPMEAQVISYLLNCGVHWRDIYCFLFLDIYCLIFQPRKGFMKENDSYIINGMLPQETWKTFIHDSGNFGRVTHNFESLWGLARNSNLATWKTLGIQSILCWYK